ncbi:phosphotransferase enzyme family protein [Amniculicola lignicola CBS 123094]|uniref:Phosphotransferase enzyme family protein n=1 Tax=Amniculicola lignicola CBS 123094 TaxID=1392246 RepID=A0A6A5WGJ7_9PLEO|nr:phosphotransferase enzyme family protein [Amniculicola lignicola CBS 123094]
MAATQQNPFTALPDGSLLEMDFLDSSWFQPHVSTRTFPSPEEVRSVALTQRGLRWPAKFENLGLIVKFGRQISTQEAINLWAIRKVIQNQTLVPEVYGWRVVQNGEFPEVFIYMQLVQGPTLAEQWDSMLVHDKQTVCNDLHVFVSRYREFRQNESAQVIGSVSHGLVPDRCLKQLPYLKLFPTRASFQDWLSWLWRRHDPDPQSIEDPWREILSDRGPIVFTHGDLRPTNIIVTTTSPTRLVSVIDWEQAGWYPDYWESCKARYTAAPDGEWWGWIDHFVTPNEAAYESFSFYVGALGLF